MKKVFLFIAALLVTIPLLGCLSKESEEPTPEPFANEEPADPLAEARAKLFLELGLDENGQSSSETPKNPEPLPVVFQNPPELPALDGNGSEPE